MGEFYNPDKLYKGGSRNNSLINKKMIFRVLGVLLFIESAMFLLCAAVSLCYGEQDYQYFSIYHSFEYIGRWSFANL